MTHSRPSATQSRWQRVFSGAVSEVASAERWLDSIAADLAIPKSRAADMQVCLEELMANVLQHGGNGHPLSISVAVEAFPGRVTMTVEDNGRPFNVEQAPAKGIDTPLDKVQPGGLGIHLIKSFATQLHYTRIKSGNRVILEFAG